MSRNKPRIKHYGDGITRNAVKSFARMLPKMGNITVVRGEFDNSRKWYRVRFINDMGHQFVFHGFAWWFGGEGPNGLVKCLISLGFEYEQVKWLMGREWAGDNHMPNCWKLEVPHALGVKA